MLQLSPAGQTAIQDIAQRHGFSFDAVMSMLQSVINGNGRMAQFSHSEFGGSGQWMQGGMTMIGDMFNNYLKGRVDNLCAELSRLVASQPDMIRTGSFQSQSQNGNTSVNSWGSNASPGSANNPNSLFVTPPAQPDWWGPELKFPNSSGGQNGMRYAWFSQAHRLAMEANGNVTIYDTLDHQIGGVSQQSGSQSPSFSSQYGYVDVSQLPVVSVNGVAPMAPFKPAPVNSNNNNNNNSGYSSGYSSSNHNAAPAYSPAPANNAPATSASGDGDIFAHLEKLAALQSRGILTDQEYAAKKAELLSRL